MKLYALSDLHVGFEANFRALDSLAEHREDWLVLGGDGLRSFTSTGVGDEYLRMWLPLCP